MPTEKAHINTKALRILLAENDISQKKLSETSGVKPTTLYKVIKGKANPTLTIVQKIAEALNLTDEEIREIFFSKEELK